MSWVFWEIVFEMEVFLYVVFGSFFENNVFEGVRVVGWVEGEVVFIV